jgi:hypothetical protein
MAITSLFYVKTSPLKALTLFTLTRPLIPAVAITCYSKMNAKRQEGTGMANQEHLDILKKGVQVWNQWRKEHPDIIVPDLSGVDLSGADLNHANPHYANLRGTELSDAILGDADLSMANLTGTGLSGAILSNADLSYTDLSDAFVVYTRFGDVDLSTVKGLETVKHWGPSTIGIDTIIRSQGKIPEIFLRKAGVPNSIIEAIPALVGSLKPIDYYSCFISYSSKDEALARQLYADLQSNHVRCWFAPEDLKIGGKIRTGIDEAIRLHDKLLLVLSKSSVASGWVEREVKAALVKERKEKITVLFPVRVDKAVFDSPFDWATEIRHERNIGDFTRWKNHDDYEKAFSRLLRDLKAETQKMESRDTKTQAELGFG